jgi:uncharacterized membrane protein YuzA (DUF378 family)
MPKALCLISLVASALVVLAFLADAVFGFMGNTALAPFGAANMVMDIVFVIVGGIMVFMSFKTFREQR